MALSGLLKSVVKVAGAPLKAAGPLIKVAAPALGVPPVALAAGAALATAAKKGDPKAKAQVVKLAAKAKAGDPKAVAALKTVQDGGKLVAAQRAADNKANAISPGYSDRTRGGLYHQGLALGLTRGA